MTEFRNSVRRYFEFLTSEFGFVLTAQTADHVRYDAPTVYVEIWSGQGEIDLLFGVKIDTEILRPYVSHVFSFAEVVRYYKAGPFPVFESFPSAEGISKEERFLNYLATLTRNYCGDVLRGDITALETLSVNRGAKHR